MKALASQKGKFVFLDVQTGSSKYYRKGLAMKEIECEFMERRYEGFGNGLPILIATRAKEETKYVPKRIWSIPVQPDSDMMNKDLEWLEYEGE